MIAVVQRVKKASVDIDERNRESIDEGLVVFLGVETGDTHAEARGLAKKVANLRIFDKEGRMELSVLDKGAELLVVSQFTLCGNCRKGNRPDFSSAKKASEAKPLYQSFVAELKGFELAVKTGQFQARMLVEIYNEGPVTIILRTGGEEK